MSAASEFVDQKMKDDPEYAPYCMRCPGLQRMERVSTLRAQCPVCPACHVVLERLKEYPRNGEPRSFVTIHHGIGGWNSGLWVWSEFTQEDVDQEDTHPDIKPGDGFYEPWNTGITNTSLGTGLRKDAVAEALSWAESEELPVYIPEEEPDGEVQADDQAVRPCG